MRIAIIGTHGIPVKYGGFETFAEHLSLLLNSKGYDVYVTCNKGSYDSDKYLGISLHFLSYAKYESPFRFYFQGILWGMKNTDIIIVTGSGGAIFYPLLRLFKKSIILTNTDGIENKRDKYGFLAKTYARIAELSAVLFSDIVIADSMAIKQHLECKYKLINKTIRVIEYGAYENNLYDSNVLKIHNIQINKFFLIVARLEPENNIKMMIEGYLNSKIDNPLIVVGNIKETKFVKDLVKKYSSVRIRFIGGIYNPNELASLRYACKAYLHGHSVGGTNPSLLEAMANSNIIIAHDNPFNREVTYNKQLYFSNSNQLTVILDTFNQLDSQNINSFKNESVKRIREYYTWENIANKYISVFNEVKKLSGLN